MPIYEYKCTACGERVEAIQLVGDSPLTKCEHCGDALRRMQSAPSFQFKGSGWYVTDYAKSGGDKGGGDSSGDKGGGDSSGDKSGGDKGASENSGKGSSAAGGDSASSSKTSKSGGSSGSSGAKSGDGGSTPSSAASD